MLRDIDCRRDALDILGLAPSASTSPGGSLSPFSLAIAASLTEFLHTPFSLLRLGHLQPRIQPTEHASHNATKKTKKQKKSSSPKLYRL
jgi:hypothetical protein